MSTGTNLTTLPRSPLMDPDSFGHMQRVASILAVSPLFPEHLRKGSKEQAIANGVLVMNMAIRLNEDPLTVSQNIYFVGGRPGWSASYMISKANQHGVFKNPIDWNVTGSGETLSVTAVATVAATGKEVKVTCDMKMAKAEGWTKNAKYQSMPEQMLRYRSATFLIRLYCPEVMVGVPSMVEIEANNMKDITPYEQAEIYRAQDEPAAKDEPQEKPTEKKQAEPAKDQKNPEAEPQSGVEDGDDRESLQRLFNMIVADLHDGAPGEATRKFYEEPIAKIKARSEDLAKKLEEEFEAAQQ